MYNKKQYYINEIYETAVTVLYKWIDDLLLDYCVFNSVILQVEM